MTILSLIKIIIPSYTEEIFMEIMFLLKWIS